MGRDLAHPTCRMEDRRKDCSLATRLSCVKGEHKGTKTLKSPCCAGSMLARSAG